MTTSTHRVEGLKSAVAMATAIERLARLPGVTQVTVNLARQRPSTLYLRSTSGVSVAQVSACLRAVGASLTGTRSPQVIGLQRTFTRSA